MPKLTMEEAKVVETAEEAPEYHLLDPGVYLCKLVKVDVSENPGDSGFHYWKTTLEVVKPEKDATSWLWTNLSLSPKAAFRIKEFFTAFGFSADSDTDEMIGEQCVVEVVQKLQKGGKRKGEMGHEVDNLLPVNEETTRYIDD